MKDQSTNRTTKTNKSSPHALQYHPPLPRVVSRRPYVRWIVALLTAIGLIAAAWRITQMRQRPHMDGFATQSPTVQVPADNVTTFYRREISPLLDAALQRNRQAAARAIDALHERFDVHRVGVKPFAQDVSGWRTRFGVMRCFVTDQWDRHVRGNKVTNHVADYIQAKFRVHVLSEQSLQADLEDVLKQYRGDLEASRNHLFAEIKLPLQGSQSPIVLADGGWDGLYADIEKRANQLNATTPRDTVVTGLASVAGGWVGTEAGGALAAEILARVGASLAVDVAGDTAMVGGTATGAGAGSLAGPAGTAIGVGAGLAIGAAVDWWTTHRLEARLTDKCNTFLDAVERGIVEGGAKSPGLRQAFEQGAKIADQNQRQAIIETLLESRR